ncbi:MAG TPA: hypothetical protein VFD32_18515, partial [Dehalococcoidia bacterium]|nr:hypothetical protein [Dehalococcoidia bacterium]
MRRIPRLLTASLALVALACLLPQARRSATFAEVSAGPNDVEDTSLVAVPAQTAPPVSLGGDRHAQQISWFYGPRQVGLGGESYTHALAHAAQQGQALARPAVGNAAVTTTWTNLGPNPILGGQTAGSNA